MVSDRRQDPQAPARNRQNRTTRSNARADRRQRSSISPDANEQVAFFGISLIGNPLLVIGDTTLNQPSAVGLGPPAQPADRLVDVPGRMDDQPETRERGSLRTARFQDILTLGHGFGFGWLTSAAETRRGRHPRWAPARRDKPRLQPRRARVPRLWHGLACAISSFPHGRRTSSRYRPDARARSQSP